jgi:hypothetical protein
VSPEEARIQERRLKSFSRLSLVLSRIDKAIATLRLKEGGDRGHSPFTDHPQEARQITDIQFTFGPTKSSGQTPCTLLVPMLYVDAHPVGEVLLTELRRQRDEIAREIEIL